jgi:MFS family permease
VFEWYDFFLYGALAAVISKQFFAGVNDTTAFIFALMAFAAGFVVRPFGALVFGRLGDMIGRKYTFLATIILMGIATFCVGLLPTYASIGIAAPIILVALRMLQGLALGGEYGGAATYVAEHAPIGKRGFPHQLDSIHRDPRPAAVATGGARLPLLHWRSVRSLGLAYSVPAVDRAAGDFHLDSPEPARVARVPENERGRQNLRRRRSANLSANGKTSKSC